MLKIRRKIKFKGPEFLAGLLQNRESIHRHLINDGFEGKAANSYKAQGRLSVLSIKIVLTGRSEFLYD